MATLANQMAEKVKKAYRGFVTCDLPRWLRSSRWVPSMILYSKDLNTYLAVALEPSGKLPEELMRREILPVLKRNADSLVVLVCVPETALDKFPETESLCQELGFGLKKYEEGLGLSTVVESRLDARVTVRIPLESGYFPQQILDRAKGLKRLMFGQVLDRYIAELERIQASGRDVPNRSKDLLLRAMDDLLGSHPLFKRNIGQFMRLDHFEQLLQGRKPSSSEHIYHAFRVFLAGCPVVDHFYDDFLAAHKFYSDGCKKVHVEYAWLLTSLFHDIGRTRGNVRDYAAVVVQDELQDVDVEVTIRAKDLHWQKPSYRTSVKILSSLAACLAGSERTIWDGGALQDEDGERLEVEWIRLYDNPDLHGVAGAIEFLRTVCENARAADERKSRPFVLAHAVPAAAAILLHDWKVHNDAKKWGLFPISTQRAPLASLLFYVDTWDDYKRKNEDAQIFIRSYELKKRRVEVVVEWANSMLFENEQIKYNAYKRALKDRIFDLEVTARMVQ